MKHRMKQILCLFFAAVMIILTGADSMTVLAKESYTYSQWDEAVPAPPAYDWKLSIRAADLGIDAMTNISDVFYRNGLIYITMSGKVVILNSEFQTEHIITAYQKDGTEDKISEPKGIFVTKENEIYITEQDRGEIVHFGADYQFIRTLKEPKITGLETKYAPVKVCVDDVGRIYVKAKSVYEGIIELDPDGNFNRFVGANQVQPSFIDRFWRMIATEEQISRMELWLPTDYSDLALDKDGFLFATVKDASSLEPVRKLNSSGVDIMNQYDFIKPPMGDYENGNSISTLTTVTCAEDGRFAVLDTANSKIFVYSEDAILAYVIGGPGKTKGALNSPIDLCFMEDKILVADLVTNSIEVFEATEYGTLINQALYYQGQFNYEEAAKYWIAANEINENSVITNMGLGKYYIRQENFEAAMNTFKKVGERSNYSIAYSRVRENFMEQNFGLVLLCIIAVIAVICGLKYGIKKCSEKGMFEKNKFFEKLREFRYEFFTFPGYVLSHPFKAFDDMKYLNAGSVKFSVVVVILVAWVSLIEYRYTGFISNLNNLEQMNLPLILVSSVFGYLIFTVANWAVAVLIDGKGNLKTIFKVNMYALYPMVFLTLLGVIVSNFIIIEESAFVSFLFVFPMVIYVFYTFIGLITVHQFTFTKGVFSVLLSFIAMIIILFVLTLLLTLVSGFINDVVTIVDEFLLHF